MGERWIAEAEDLKTGSNPGMMVGGQPKVTWHVTVCPSGGGFFDAMHRVLVDKAAEPHLLYDPLTDRLGQYFPLDTSARALRNDGDRRTNGSGSVNIQVEIVAMPDDFTRYWKPGPNYRAMMRAIRSWGVPDAWPGGNPYGRPARTWEAYSKAGHFGHVHVPGNDHYDPQVRNGELLFAAAPTTTKDWFDMASLDDLRAAVKAELNDEFKRDVARYVLTGYATGPVDGQRVLAGHLTDIKALAAALLTPAQLAEALKNSVQIDVTVSSKE